MQIIDIHPHIVSRDTERYPVTPIGGKQSTWSKERSATIDELIAAMDAGGIDKGAIVHSSTTYGFNNDCVVDAVAAHPARFTGVFSVDVMAPDAPERMRHWFGRGMTGMRIYAGGSTMKKDWLTLDHPATMPAWECAAELGISVATNVNARGESLAQIEAVLRRFPEVPLIIDHFGRPSIDDGPPYHAAADYFALADFPNLYLKYSLSGLHSMLKGEATADTFVAKAVDVFGADRIAWGSNYPSAPGTLGEILAGAMRVCDGLPEADRGWIFGGTARRLYPALRD